MIPADRSIPDPDQFATGWATAWNAHDVEAVLSHFAEDAVFTSPVATRVVPGSAGVLRGKAAIRDYWATALRGLPDLHFEVLGSYAGVDTLVINYRNQRGGLVNEVLTFADGLVVHGRGTYLEGAASDVGAMDGPALQLTGQRVTLLPVRGEHVAELRRIRRTPEVESRWGVETYDAPWPFGDPGATVFSVLVDGAVRGLIQYGEEDQPDYRHATIDMFLDPQIHGQGVGRDAVLAMVQHLVEDRGHRRITIDPAADNEAAIRCYAAAGFRPVGVLRGYERDADGQGWHDGLLMELLADDRLSSPGTAPALVQRRVGCDAPLHLSSVGVQGRGGPGSRSGGGVPAVEDEIVGRDVLEGPGVVGADLRPGLRSDLRADPHCPQRPALSWDPRDARHLHRLGVRDGRHQHGTLDRGLDLHQHLGACELRHRFRPGPGLGLGLRPGRRGEGAERHTGQDGQTGADLRRRDRLAEEQRGSTGAHEGLDVDERARDNGRYPRLAEGEEDPGQQRAHDGQRQDADERRDARQGRRPPSLTIAIGSAVTAAAMNCTAVTAIGSRPSSIRT